MLICTKWASSENIYQFICLASSAFYQSPNKSLKKPSTANNIHMIKNLILLLSNFFLFLQYDLHIF